MIRLIAWYWLFWLALMKLLANYKFEVKEDDPTFILIINALLTIFTALCCVVVALHILELLSPILFGGAK